MSKPKAFPHYPPFPGLSNSPNSIVIFHLLVGLSTLAPAAAAGTGTGTGNALAGFGRGCATICGRAAAAPLSPQNSCSSGMARARMPRHTSQCR